ncbi:MAG: ABC transporter permease [Bacillota bacterium]|nr:MAG: ABC transporter permease [Bacillota bacterium]
MFSFIARRLWYFIPTALGAVTLVFIIVRLAPGDVVSTMLQDFQADPEMIALLRHQYGLDEPLYYQYLKMIWDIFRGDLGVSMLQRQPVLAMILPHVRPTVMLAFSGLLIAMVIGVPAGIVSALRRNTRVDYTVMSLATFWLSAPGFWLGIFLIYVFSYKLGWFPMYGSGMEGTLGMQLRSLILPAIAIGARSAAVYARISRSSALDIFRQDYVRTARAKGLAERVVVYKHVLRNAAIPIITVIGMDLAFLLCGTVVIENVFSRAGLGTLMVNAIANRDYPVVQGTILVFAVMIIAINLLMDVVYRLLDPRIKID